MSLGQCVCVLFFMCSWFIFSDAHTSDIWQTHTVPHSVAFFRTLRMFFLSLRLLGASTDILACIYISSLDLKISQVIYNAVI